ncbi:MAG: N-6 DNA methylase [Planctomycetes bacterium]|nr:N-6 DNA methylase [Planctomycetota bacterium]
MNFKKNESAQKLRGGYYTPLDLANYLARWVGEIKPKNILEPSCGDGAFIEAIASSISNKTAVTGIELELEEAEKARNTAESLKGIDVTIENADFLQWFLDNIDSHAPFDAILGNPPFIRYQYLTKQTQKLSATIFKKFNLPFTKHTNAWVPFVIASLALLGPGGRIAMVLPSEIIHIMHAQSLRNYIGQHCKRLIIVDPEEIWFEGTLQGAVLFLAEKKLDTKERTVGLGIIPTKGKKFLNASPSEYFKKTNFINGKTIEGKWTRALLTKGELNLYDEITSKDDVHQFSDIADVKVGLVTGANKFFLVNDETVKKYDLKKWAHPMFGRSIHCPGAVYDKKQHLSNSNSGLPSNFIWFDVNDKSELSKSALKYISEGEMDSLHERYKCRIRTPWFKVPYVYSTSIGMLKRANNFPRLIYNDIEAYTTDTAYRITTTNVNAKKLVYCFVNSLTALSSELEGRHYGGGVLELVPSEIGRLFIPIPRNTKPALMQLDHAIRKTSPRDILARQDNKILRKLGLSNNEILCMHNAWNRLRNRRQRTSGETNQ